MTNLPPPQPGEMSAANVARFLQHALASTSGKRRLTKADRAALAQIVDEAGVILARKRGRPKGTTGTGRIDPAAVRKLRAEGLSYTAIGQRLGCTRSAAQKAGTRPGSETTQETEQ